MQVTVLYVISSYIKADLFLDSAYHFEISLDPRNLETEVRTDIIPIVFEFFLDQTVKRIFVFYVLI